MNDAMVAVAVLVLTLASAAAGFVLGNIWRSSTPPAQPPAQPRRMFIPDNALREGVVFEQREDIEASGIWYSWRVGM